MTEGLWALAIRQAREALAGADEVDFAVEALIRGSKAAPCMESYSLLREAGMLLATAGRLDHAREIVRTDLRHTPAQWEGGPVYAAIVARMSLDGDDARALDVLREAAASAEKAGIYERADEFPGVYDLMEALDWFALGPLVGVVAESISPAAHKAIMMWHRDYPSPRVGYPGAAPIEEAVDEDLNALIAEGALAGIMNVADAGANLYIRIVNFTAVARAAAKKDLPDLAEVALLRALDLQSGSFDEEGRRFLIYHEEFRFRAAQRLGDAAHMSLAGNRRRAFAQAAFERAAGLSDSFEGAGLVVAAGRAAVP